MKLSLIFGVLHMTFGIICKGSNLVVKKMWLELVTEVIGGFLLLWFLMGLMDLLIIAKWFRIPDIDDISKKIHVNGGTEELYIGDYLNGQYEGIISIMVTTVFQFGSFEQRKNAPFIHPLIFSNPELPNDELNNKQYSFCLTLVVIAILLIFVMLCTKPCLVKCKGDSHVHENEGIEFQAIAQNDDKDKMNIKSINNADSSRGDMSSEEIMQRRAN